jgi:PTS system nitrogen regulatory IIA component
MDLLSLVDNRVYLDVDVKDTIELFSMLSSAMSTDDLSSESIYYHLNMRESLGSTALGFGVAIPHGRISSLKSTFLSIVRTLHAIEFNAPDFEKVKIFITILVPEHATQEHLDLLATIAGMLSDEDFRESILSAQHVEDIFQAIQVQVNDK